MTVAYRLERFRGSGTVFIAWLEGDRYYSGYWDSFPEEDPPTALEQMPETHVHRRGRRVGSWANPEGPDPARERSGRVLLGRARSATGGRRQPQATRRLGTPGQAPGVFAYLRAR